MDIVKKHFNVKSCFNHDFIQFLNNYLLVIKL